jgi:hypothetical protein
MSAIACYRQLPRFHLPRDAKEKPPYDRAAYTNLNFSAQDTVNVPLLAVPPGVVTAMFPVLAPVGTVAVICVPEFTV